MFRYLVLAALLSCLQVVACSSGPSKTVEPPDSSPRAADTTSSIIASDRSAVAQATLEVAELQQYFHGRKPLRVVVNRSVNPAWRLAHSGEPIEWVDETSEDARIEFTLLRVEGDKAAAHIRYEIEGVVMHAEFKRGGAGWELIKSDLAEE